MSLTICIPTYNRSSKLRECLACLCSTILTLDYEHHVKVFVSDNDSQDDTEYICQQYLDYEWFDYVRQKKNIGLDGQHLFFSQNVKTKYMWVQGDDDLIPKETLLFVLKTINTEEIDAIFLNTSPSVATANPWLYAIYPKTYPDKIISTNVEKALNIIRDNFQFIASQVFKIEPVRSAYILAFNSGLRDINTYAALVAMGGKCVIFPHLFVLTNRMADDRYADNYDQRWVMTFWDRPKQAITLYETSYRRLNKNKLSRFYLRQDFQFVRTYLMYAVDHPEYSESTLSDISYLHYWYSKIIVMFIMLMPNSLLVVPMSIYRFFKYNFLRFAP